MPRHNSRARGSQRPSKIRDSVARMPERMSEEERTAVDKLFRVVARTDRKIAARSRKTSERADVPAPTLSTTATDLGSATWLQAKA